MSEFNTYVKRVNDVATKVFADYSEKEKAFKDAKEELNNISLKGSEIEKAKAKLQFEKEKEAFDGFFRNAPEQANKEIAIIREELSQALTSKYAFDVSKVDAVTLDLLKSGLLTSDEYADILTEAEKQGNNTLAVLVGRYAVEQAKGTNDKTEQDALYRIHARSKRNSEGEFIESFDVLTEIFNRTMNNTGMIKHWDRLTKSIIENF